MYRDVKKKPCEKRMSKANSSKRINVYRYAIRNRLYLIASMFLSSIPYAIVIETGIGFPFGWFIISLFILMNLHPCLNTFVPRLFDDPNDIISTINWLYNTQIFVPLAITFSFLSFLMLVILTLCFYFYG